MIQKNPCITLDSASPINTTFEGKVPYDSMLAETEIPMELELCWTVKAGIDPVELFKKHPGRFHLWHVKTWTKRRKVRHQSVPALLTGSGSSIMRLCQA